MRVPTWLLFLVTTIVAVAAARVLGLWVVSAFSQPVQNGSPLPALTFIEEDLTFGPIPEGVLIEREVRLTNPSAEPVKVHRFEKSCSCLEIEPAENLTVPPGGTAVLRIKLKSTIPLGARLSAEGLFSESVTVSALAVGEKPIRFSADLRFTVQQTISLDPPQVRLGVVSHRDPVSVKATLTLFPPIKDIRVLAHPEWNVTVTPQGEGKRELVATPLRLGISRSVNDAIQVIPIGADGEDRPVRPLLIRGEVRLDIGGSPAEVMLGRVKVGATCEEPLRFVSLTGRKFHLIRVAAEQEDVRVHHDSTHDRYSVLVKVRAEGDQERMVIARVRQDDGTELSVAIPVRYHGEQGVPE